MLNISPSAICILVGLLGSDENVSCPSKVFVLSPVSVRSYAWKFPPLVNTVVPDVSTLLESCMKPKGSGSLYIDCYSSSQWERVISIHKMKSATTSGRINVIK